MCPIGHIPEVHDTFIISEAIADGVNLLYR